MYKAAVYMTVIPDAFNPAGPLAIFMCLQNITSLLLKAARRLIWTFGLPSLKIDQSNQFSNFVYLFILDYV